MFLGKYWILKVIVPTILKMVAEQSENGVLE